MALEHIQSILQEPKTRITALTGAGISAASGIPTFRGPGGYWTVGSKHYLPQEIATQAMFSRHPKEVWTWYVSRLGGSSGARPNQGHDALVQMERSLQDRFTLITQNIDNLHILAGNTLQRTLQIHGNINFTRCSRACSAELFALAEALKTARENNALNDDELALLRCPSCSAWLRPHVLWFDEEYDEYYFRSDSALSVASNTDLLIIAGTSGATTLPNAIANRVYERGGCIIDVNIEENSFTELALASDQGLLMRESSVTALPKLAELCA